LARQQAECNLAQGPFARREPSGHWARWRPLAALLGLWLVLQWGFNLAQGWYLQCEGERYAEASEALYRELFPEDSKLINLRAQFDQHLAEAQGGGQQQLLQLLDQAAAAIGEEGARVQVQQLDFNAERGDLALNLQASDFSALESLRTRLQEAGLAVDMGSASREDNGVSARLVIGGNG
ncbi:type II secretion system protein GspL, partial [Aquipseudomonas alcaligenes]